MREYIRAGRLEKRVKTTAEAIEEVNIAKNLIGSAAAGSMAYHAHYANMVAALSLIHI